MRKFLLFVLVLFSFLSMHEIYADNKEAIFGSEISAVLIDNSTLNGEIIESRFIFHTFYGDLEVPFTEVKRIINNGDLQNIKIEMKNGDILKGSFDKKYLRINCILGNVKLFFEKIKMISFSRSITLDKNFEKDWNIEFINANRWNYSIVDTTLVVKEIIPSIINKEGGGTWAIVRLVKDISPIQDFSAMFKYRWDLFSKEATPMQYVKLKLYNTKDEIIAGGGYTDGWISYTGTQIFILGNIEENLGKGISPPSGRSKLTLRRSREFITIYINDEEVISGKNSDSIKKIIIEFGFYSLINPEQNSSFGNLSIEKFSLIDN